MEAEPCTGSPPYADPEHHLRRDALVRHALFERIEERGDVAGLLRRDTHLGHGIPGEGFLRILNPPRHVFRGIADEAC